MNHSRDTLTEAIAQEEARLARLDAERVNIVERLDGLRKQLSAADTKVVIPPETTILSSTEKIILFRSLFKGREDVYPKLWVSKNGDRKGYMPACANDGVYTLCGKRKTPRVRCSDCNHQAYLPLTDDVVKDHLQGKQTIGIYPLLPDDTCWFLAVDFDKCSGKNKPNGMLDVAMMQSLVRKDEVADLVADYGQVIVSKALMENCLWEKNSALPRNITLDDLRE